MTYSTLENAINFRKLIARQHLLLSKNGCRVKSFKKRKFLYDKS